MVKICRIVLISLSVFSPELFSQTRLLLSQATVYDQNIFRNYQGITDWVNQFSLYFAHDFKIKTLQGRFEYEGDLNLFYHYQERLFHTHKLGLESSLPLRSNLHLNIGTDYQWRKNKPDFNIYDSANWLTFAHIKGNWWQPIPVQLGYEYFKRTFTNLPEFSYNEHFSFLRLTHFFPTKTTLIGEIGLAAKKYVHQQLIQEIIIYKHPGSSNGKGYGGGKQGSQFRADTATVAHNLTVPKTRQWSLIIRLAQSITPKTGLSIEYTRRFKPSENTRYLLGQEYTYSRDDELYDDPYTYGSHEWQLVLTQLLPGFSRMKIYAKFSQKSYVYPVTGELNEESDLSESNRQDQQKVFGIDLSKQIGLNRMIQTVKPYFSYSHLINKSNEPYFDFQGHLFSGGLDLTF